MSDCNRPILQRQVTFDRPPEIFAVDGRGVFRFALTQGEVAPVDLTGFDEVRMTISIWHPSDKQVIDYDRAYVELRASLDPAEEHWTRLAEVEPVVPPYDSGQRFDGWLVLPVLAGSAAFQLYGGGFEPRSRLQIRATGFLVG